MQENWNLPLTLAEKWKCYLQELYEEKWDHNKEQLDAGKITTDGGVEDIAVEILGKELKNMENRKAPGPGGMPVVLTKHSETNLNRIL